MSKRLIKLLGVPSVRDAAGEIQDIRGHQAWALLARVLLSRSPIDRKTLAGDLFPETVDPLGSLRWCLASLRKALDCPDALRSDPVEANLPADTAVDVLSLASDDFVIEDAGELLEGLEPRCSPEFSTWLLIERERIASTVGARIRKEILKAIASGSHERAIRLAELGARRQPYDEGAHVLLIRSLAKAGKHETAATHAIMTEKRFLEELGEMPSAALRSAARPTVASPPAGVSAEAVVDTLIQSGKAALTAGAVDAGIDCLRRAANDADKTNDRHLQALAAFELGTALVHAIRGYDDEGSILLRQAIELTRQSGDAGIAASGLRELGYIEALAGRRPAAAQYLAEALEVADGTESLAGIHSVIGFNFVDWGRLDEALGHYGQALEMARSAGNRRREIWALGLGAKGQMAAGDIEGAGAWLNQCLQLISDQGWMSFRPWPIALLSELKLRQGTEPAVLRPELERSFALSCQIADPCWEGAVGRVMALCHMADGEIPEAMTWLGDAARRCRRETDGYAALDVEIRADLAHAALLANQPDEAKAHAREWVALAARAHMDAQVGKAAKFIADHRG